MQKTLSRAERVILTLTACVLCFVIGWFLRGAVGIDSSALSVETLPARSGVSATAEQREEGETQTQQALPADTQLDADPSTVQETALININTADAEALMTLPNIGETRAQSIIAYRETNGPFEIIEQLTDVSGIGEKIFASIEPFITVE